VRVLRAILKRLLAALAAVAAGWLAGLAAVWAVLALTATAPGFEWRFWAVMSGVYCLLGWVIVGGPLAVLGTRFPPGAKRATAVLVVGLIGFAMIAATFGSYALRTAQGWTLLAFAGGDALATAGVSMLVYCVLLERLS
jgi:hypothetical protein